MDLGKMTYGSPESGKGAVSRFGSTKRLLANGPAAPVHQYALKSERQPPFIEGPSVLFDAGWRCEQVIEQNRAILTLLVPVKTVLTCCNGSTVQNTLVHVCSEEIA